MILVADIGHPFQSGSQILLLRRNMTGSIIIVNFPCRITVDEPGIKRKLICHDCFHTRFYCRKGKHRIQLTSHILKSGRFFAIFIGDCSLFIQRLIRKFCCNPLLLTRFMDGMIGIIAGNQISLVLCGFYQLRFGIGLLPAVQAYPGPINPILLHTLKQIHGRCVHPLSGILKNVRQAFSQRLFIYLDFFRLI